MEKKRLATSAAPVVEMEGMWPSFICIPVPRRKIAKIANRCIAHYMQTEGISSDQISPCEEMHISLSKSFSLRYFQIEMFVKTLAKALELSSSFMLPVNEEYRLFHNNNYTSLFVGIHLSDQARHLASLVQCIDTILVSFMQDPFFEPPHFHISVANYRPAIDEASELCHDDQANACIRKVDLPLDDSAKSSACLVVDCGVSLDMASDEGKSDSDSDDSSELDPRKRSSLSTVLSIQFIMLSIGHRIFKIHLRDIASSKRNTGNVEEVTVSDVSLKRHKR